MVRRFVFAALFLALTLFSAARPADAFTEAGEAYVYPTFPELTQAIIMLGGMDIKDPRVLEEYIKLMYCDLYKVNFRNDFSWHSIQKQILARVTTRKEYYRSLFQVGGVVQLKQYDFNNQEFPLQPWTAFNHVGYMSLFTPEDLKPYCVFYDPKTGEGFGGYGGVLGRNINIALSEPFTFTGIKMTPKEAESFLVLLQKLGSDKDRKLFIRFRFRVQSIADSRRDPKGIYWQIVLSGEIISIDLFFDKEMTKWFMSVPIRS
jgi:hypothetical protein